MKKNLLLVTVLFCLLALSLSACYRKKVCPSCPPGIGQTQFVPQAQTSSSPTSRQSSIK